MENIKYAVIVAGGLGKRMKVINPGLPKEMLPVNNIPIIQYALEEVLCANIANVLIVINENKNIVKEYCYNMEFAKTIYPNAVKKLKTIVKNIEIRFLYQKESDGEMNAVLLAEKLIKKCPFAIIYPDELHFPTGKVLKNLCEKYYVKKKNILALAKVDSSNKNQIGNTGRINIKKMSKNLYKIIEFLPKSLEFFQLRYNEELRTCGYMISRHEIFEHIHLLRKFNIYSELNDVPIRNEMIKRYDFIGYYPETTFYDVGNPIGYKYCKDKLSNSSDHIIKTGVIS